MELTDHRVPTEALHPANVIPHSSGQEAPPAQPVDSAGIRSTYPPDEPMHVYQWFTGVPRDAEEMGGPPSCDPNPPAP